MAINLQSVLNSWKEFRLGTTQHELDDIASELTVKQDDSEGSRKRLVEQLKEFKNKASDGARNEASVIIKSFQNEVDSLNKRCKWAETNFFKIYKKVVDIVDPVPSLEYCMGIERKIGRLADLEIENKNLRETLAGYNEELKDVRNQDVTIKNLKEKLKKYEDEMEEAISLKTRELDKELMRQFAEKERLLNETQESVARRLKESESHCKMLQQTMEQTQSELFDHKSKSEEVTIAKGIEMEMLMNDYERASQKVQSAEKEISNLKEQVQKLNESKNTVLKENDSYSVDVIARSSLELEVATKEKEISQLVEDVKSLQGNLESLRLSTAQQVEHLKDQNSKHLASIEELTKQLNEQRDYNDLKRELQILKSLEFSSVCEDMESTTKQPKSLEILLLEKNKVLQNENTSIRQSNVSLTQKLSDTEEEMTYLRSLTSEQKNLIQQLESDVSAIQSLSTMYRGEGEGSPSQPEMVAEAVKGVAQIAVSETSAQQFNTIENKTVAGQPPDFGSAAESLLPIVSAQRERFRARNDDLEAEVMAKCQQAMTLQNELDSLRADNLKLYEKVRFLQSYEGNRGKKDTNLDSRYGSQYEETLDPFSSFSRKEKLRRYGALSPFEKITLSLGRFILSNKTARTVTFLYTALVHCLVFLVLYKLAYTESCKRDFATDCAQKFAEHMQQVHGDHDFHA